MAPTDQDYVQLREAVLARGLLEKTPVYYAVKIGITLLLLGAGIFILLTVKNFAVQILNAFYLAFVYVQIGLVGHDIAHQQVFRSQRLYKIFGLLHWNLLLGTSFGHWTHKHNLHHAYPNQLKKDPDVHMPFVFSQQQYDISHPLLKKVLRYQKIYFLPLFSLGRFSILQGSIRFLIQSKKNLFEFAILLLHFVAYFLLVFHVFTVGEGVIFVAIHTFAIGAYMSMVFAPNHKGMPVLGEAEAVSYRNQIVTSRNIKTNALVFFLYGGLSYQIEHHLFPTMPRKNLKAAREIVLPFCKKKNIPYHETTILQSLREILNGLGRYKNISAVQYP